MQTAKITFIIPTIGRLSLQNSLNSLYSQTNENWECIIVYDGVEPNITIEDDRIKIIEISKKGVVGRNHGMAGLVRNEALKYVKTDWIGFLDDDDSLNEKYVETFESYINNDNEIGLILWKMLLNKLVIPRDNNLVFGNVGISFCFKRNLVGDIMFTNNRDGEDFDLFNELSKKTKFIISDDVMYYVNK